MIYRDIIDRYDIKNPTALKYIIKKSMSNISNYLSVNKLFNELKSSGVKAGKDSIYLFLNDYPSIIIAGYVVSAFLLVVILQFFKEVLIKY